jgi:hypothetical protein
LKKKLHEKRDKNVFTVKGKSEQSPVAFWLTKMSFDFFYCSRNTLKVDHAQTRYPMQTPLKTPALVVLEPTTFCIL